MSIATRIAELHKIIPEGVTLVAVSKMRPVEDIMEAYSAGQRLFGESRPQELVAKHEQLPGDIVWHQIGHLQRNKVRMIIPFVSMIHSLDSERLLETVDAEAARVQRIVDVLFEVRIGQEETKHGWRTEQLTEFLDQKVVSQYVNVRFRGVMGIATNSDDRALLRSEFTGLREVFEELRRRFFGPEFDTVSMGMSADYELATECGSTMVRVGSGIFGRSRFLPPLCPALFHPAAHLANDNK